MTVIACRDGIMAADSGVYQGDLHFGVTQKIRRLVDGSLVAACGSRPLIQEFHRWIMGGGGVDKPDAVEPEMFGGLWLKCDGTIWRITHKFEVYDDPCAFAAEGMNANFMLGAMAHGASAEQAVRLALKYSDGAWGDCQVEKLPDFTSPFLASVERDLRHR